MIHPAFFKKHFQKKKTNFTSLPLQGLTAVDVTDDSSLIAGGFADSTVRVWSVTPKKLRKVKSAAGTTISSDWNMPGYHLIFNKEIQMFSCLLPEDLNLIDKESDDVLERIMDEKTASESKILHGHSGPVYGISFSPDR